MPLLRFDLVQGRSPAELQTLLDAAHQAMLEAFEVPPGDRYQIVHEHPPAHLVVEDTGLGIPRTDKRVVLQVTTRPRSREMKEAFYRLLCQSLQEKCGIPPTDVGGIHDQQYRRRLVVRPRPGAVPHRRTLNPSANRR